MMISFQDKFEAKMRNNIEPLTIAALGLGAYGLGKGVQSYFGGRAASRAAGTQARAATGAMGRLEELYGQAGQQFQPYQQAGAQGLQALTGEVLGGGFQTEIPQFQYEAFDIEADPGYQFRQEESQRAIERSAAARGGALGGGTLQALQERSQQLASEEAQRAYQRYTGERAFEYGQLGDIYGRQVQQQGIRAAGLTGLAGMGERAATRQAGLATGLGTNLANLITGRGAAVSAGEIAQGQFGLGGTLGGIGQQLGGLAMGYGLGAFGSPGAAGATAGGGGYPYPGLSPIPQAPPLYPPTGLYGR